MGLGGIWGAVYDGAGGWLAEKISQLMHVKLAQWTKYTSTSGIQTDVTGQLSADDLSAYSEFQTDANTCIAQWIPLFIIEKYDILCIL